MMMWLKNFLQRTRNCLMLPWKYQFASNFVQKGEHAVKTADGEWEADLLAMTIKYKDHKATSYRLYRSLSKEVTDKQELQKGPRAEEGKGAWVPNNEANYCTR